MKTAKTSETTKLTIVAKRRSQEEVLELLREIKAKVEQQKHNMEVHKQISNV